ncbi:VOC family protein [Enterovibrio paralichthyis]|uniref:VOC family protein n=1 Tax=Enterovibrio paralichthyis TaxID=2853805 RepID=UPI001C4955A9|nr:VOC family protein [Enterovibrio paralichthyis]MBV7297333.1 VOC family protein [Enterovibrio paralichthyis]
MLEILDIDHLVLRTDKRNEMVTFYTEVLGCIVERETAPEVGLIQLRAGNALIDIVSINSQLGALGGDAPGETGNNMDHFCLRIAAQDETAILEHLASHGVKTEGFKKRYGAQGFGNSIYIQDPQGNTVELRCTLA